MCIFYQFQMCIFELVGELKNKRHSLWKPLKQPRLSLGLLVYNWNSGLITYVTMKSTAGPLLKLQKGTNIHVLWCEIWDSWTLSNFGENSSLIVDPKGRLISKFLLVSPILPKDELENSNFCPRLLGQQFFVRFLGELKKRMFFRN